MGFIINPYLFAAATDADADAFISAAGITDSTQQSAIQTLVTDLKGYGIWTKMKAIYPFVGGTASTHKWNLKDPRDLDAAFRLTFVGGFTHSSTGVQGNGTNNYGNTFFKGSNWNSIYDQSFGVYVRSDVSASNAIEIGAFSNSLGFCNYALLAYTLANNFDVAMGDFPAGLSSSNNTSKGFYCGNRVSNILRNSWKNGVKQATNTGTGGNQLTNNLYLTSYNDGGTEKFFSSKQLAFAYLGDGMTDTEQANLYTAVQAFNTTLSRNV